MHTKPKLPSNGRRDVRAPASRGHSHGHSDSHGHGNGDGHSYGDSHGHRDRNSDGDCDRNGHCDRDSYSNCYCDPDRYGDSYADRDCNLDGDADCHADGVSSTDAAPSRANMVVGITLGGAVRPMPVLDAYGRPADTRRLTAERSAAKPAGGRNHLHRRASRIWNDAAQARVNPAPRPRLGDPYRYLQPAEVMAAMDLRYLSVLGAR